MRKFVVTVSAISFMIAIANVMLVPEIVWRTMLLYSRLALGFSVLLGFLSVLLAYFVYVDGKKIENLTALTVRLCKATGVDQSTDNWKYDYLVSKYLSRGVPYPAGVIAEKISEKMKSGKYRENAIAELYSEEESRPNK